MQGEDGVRDVVPGTRRGNVHAHCATRSGMGAAFLLASHLDITNGSSPVVESFKVSTRSPPLWRLEVAAAWPGSPCMGHTAL